jgi:quinol-cytochrome oxidoreductase complex cytochrome b subunit
MNPETKSPSAWSSFLLHLHPKKVNAQSIKFTRTFGLGGISALLFVILAFTGILLRFSYVPTPLHAYNSLIDLQENSLLGGLLRNVHHWSAMLMIITVFLHLLRVFYSTSIYYERKKTWYYGLALFATVLAFNFTGYLLPWDQLSYWAVSIMTNIIEYIPWIGHGLAGLLRGGEIVNENTLLNFYTFHTALLPLLMGAFMVIHFWLVRKAKGVTIANPDKNEMTEVNPHLIQKEIIAALAVIISLLLFSMFVNAPLREMANPVLSPNPSKAPWYFMGIQELLINLHPLFVSLIIPLTLLGFFIYLPILKIPKEKTGQWFYSDKGIRIIWMSALFAALLSFVLIVVLERFSHLNNLDLPLIISTGLIPLMLYLIPAAAFVFYLRKALKADPTEIYISIMTIIISSYIIMSITGIWLRGENMQLIF